jgi:hypothetical protein
MSVKLLYPISGVEYLPGTTFYYKILSRDFCIIYHIPDSGQSIISFENDKSAITDILLALKENIIQEITNETFESISAQFYTFGHTIN